jgi:hypothetical protein
MMDVDISDGHNPSESSESEKGENLLLDLDLF